MRLKYFDSLLTSQAPEAIHETELSQLPLPLAALGALRYGLSNAVRSPASRLTIPGGSIQYRAALAFVQSRILLLPDDSKINSSLLARRTFEKYETHPALTFDTWYKSISSALATSYNKGHLRKLSKGIYQPI